MIRALIISLVLVGCANNLNIEVLEDIQKKNHCDAKYIPLDRNDDFDVTGAKYVAMYEKLITCYKAMGLTNETIDNFKDVF